MRYIYKEEIDEGAPEERRKDVFSQVVSSEILLALQFGISCVIVLLESFEVEHPAPEAWDILRVESGKIPMTYYGRGVIKNLWDILCLKRKSSSIRE